MTTTDLLPIDEYHPHVRVEGEDVPVYEVSLIEAEKDDRGYVATFQYSDDIHMSYIYLAKGTHV